MARVALAVSLKYFQKFEIKKFPSIIGMQDILPKLSGVNYETQNAKTRSPHEI